MADNFNQPERDVVLDLIRRDNPDALVPGRHMTFSVPIDAAPATGRNTLINATIRGFRDERTFFYDRLALSDLFENAAPLEITSADTLDSILGRLSDLYDVRLEQSDLLNPSFVPDPTGGIQTLELTARASSLVYLGGHTLSVDLGIPLVFEDMLGDVTSTFNTLMDHYLDSVAVSGYPLNDYYLGSLARPPVNEEVELARAEFSGFWPGSTFFFDAVPSWWDDVALNEELILRINDSVTIIRKIQSPGTAIYGEYMSSTDNHLVGANEWNFGTIERANVPSDTAPMELFFHAV